MPRTYHRPFRGGAVATLLTATALTIGPAANSLAAQEQPPPSQKAVFIAPNASGTLSQSVRVGNTLYLSGVLGTVDGALAPGGIGPETRQALANLATSLKAGGATVDDVVQCTVFIADMADFAAMNEVYVPFFAPHPPARTTVAVNGMALNARIEVQCVAVVGAGAGS